MQPLEHDPCPHWCCHGTRVVEASPLPQNCSFPGFAVSSGSALAQDLPLLPAGSEGSCRIVCSPGCQKKQRDFLPCAHRGARFSMALGRAVLPRSASLLPCPQGRGSLGAEGAGAAGPQHPPRVVPAQWPGLATRAPTGAWGGISLWTRCEWKPGLSRGDLFPWWCRQEPGEQKPLLPSAGREQRVKLGCSLLHAPTAAETRKVLVSLLPAPLSADGLAGV